VSPKFTDKRTSQVEFTFANGRVVAAKGWERTYATGSLRSPKSVGNGS
jgi:hypothetical protein